VYAYLLDNKYPYPKKYYSELDYYLVPYDINLLYDPDRSLAIEIEKINKDILIMKHKIANIQDACFEQNATFPKIDDQITPAKVDPYVPPTNNFIIGSRSFMAYAGSVSNNDILIGCAKKQCLYPHCYHHCMWQFQTCFRHHDHCCHDSDDQRCENRPEKYQAYCGEHINR